MHRVLLGKAALARPLPPVLTPQRPPSDPCADLCHHCGLKLLRVSSSRSAPWTRDSADEDLGLVLAPSPHSTSILAELS